MLTSALNLRPTVLLALIRSCWKDTGWATCDLSSHSILTWLGPPWCLCFSTAFSCQLPCQRHLINTQLPNNSHSDSEHTPGAAAPACRPGRGGSCTSGPGRRSTPPALVSGLVATKPGLRNFRAFTEPTWWDSRHPLLQPHRQSQLEMSSKILAEILPLVPLKGTKLTI